MIIINKEKELIKKQKDELSPSYINLKNPRYMEIDGKYCSSLLVVDYSREQRDLIFKPLIDTNININMSIFYEEQDPYKVVKDLTYNIGNTAVDLEAGKNKQDIDIVEYTHDDAKYIRKQLQVNDEAFYYLYVYITIYNEDLKDLKTNTDKIISILQSRGIKVRQAYFRQEQAFFSTLPLMINHKDVKEATKKNILTEGLVATYPFISSSICDTSGIFIGKNIYNNSLIFVDRYDQEKYKNANMCVFGTSGAGKSYYIKLNILRYRLFGIEQYVIDPEREYTGLCNKLEGTLLKLGPNSETYINVFDIRKESIEKGEKGFLANKIIKLIGFFNLVFGELDEEEKGLIEEKIIQTYEKKNINFDDKSLYKNNENKKIFKETIDMPILEDFYNILGEDEKTKKYQIKLLPFVKGSLNFFNKFTNVKLNNKLIVADVYELGEENLKYGMYIFTELFWDKIKENRKNKKAIYLDEIWRLIGVTSNKNVAGFVYKIFKTIRKYGGSAVAITQDISDLFSLEEGNFGKSILNNTSIKNFFSLEEENIKVLKKYTNISEKEEILFGKSRTEPVGQFVNAGGVAYRVVGLYEDLGDQSSLAFIPFSTMQTIYNKGDKLNNIIFTTKNLTSEAANETFEKEYRKVIAANHRFDPEDEGAIWIWNRFTQYMQTQNVAGLLRTAIWVIGLFTLLSGIVGVSNIMLITVKERTREFGIRKALGAKPLSILWLIIVESVTITTFFGYIGMVAGIGVTEWMNSAFGNQTADAGMFQARMFSDPTVDIGIAIQATLTLIIAGTLAGFFPAKKAVSISPIEALRSD